MTLTTALTTVAINNTIKGIIRQAKKNSKILAIALFGSYARGEQHNDIDICIFLNKAKIIYCRDEDALYELYFITLKQLEDYNYHYKEYLEAVLND